MLNYSYIAILSLQNPLYQHSDINNSHGSIPIYNITMFVFKMMKTFMFKYENISKRLGRKSSAIIRLTKAQLETKLLSLTKY